MEIQLKILFMSMEGAFLKGPLLSAVKHALKCILLNQKKYLYVYDFYNFLFYNFCEMRKTA